MEVADAALPGTRSPKVPDPPLAVYVHIPFCPTKCGYCDFNSYAMDGEIVERTTRAIIAEIRRSPWRGRPAKTIFFGGGTPTFLEAGRLLAVLEAVTDTHPPAEGAEITSEANPGTVDAAKFRAMRQGGFNRISLGAQSFLDSDLLTLGRVHRSGEIERAVAAAREAGFDSLNLDLMFALPGQSRHAWSANLDRALALEPEHLSLYCLTIEPNTPFYKLHLKGQLDLPDDEAQVAMYDDCLARTAAAGLLQYEISNFARPGHECRHNLCYWRGEEYAAYGPGAVGCVRSDERWAMGDAEADAPCHRPSPIAHRYTNLKHPERYCAAIEAGETAAYDTEPLDEQTLRTERIMLGLRLNEGLPLDEISKLRSEVPNLPSMTSAVQNPESRIEDLGLGRIIDHKYQISNLLSKGWVCISDDRLRLTPAGRHFCSEVALELI